VTSCKYTSSQFCLSHFDYQPLQALTSKFPKIKLPRGAWHVVTGAQNRCQKIYKSMNKGRETYHIFARGLTGFLHMQIIVYLFMARQMIIAKRPTIHIFHFSCQDFRFFCYKSQVPSRPCFMTAKISTFDAPRKKSLWMLYVKVCHTTCSFSFINCKSLWDSLKVQTNCLLFNSKHASE